MTAAASPRQQRRRTSPLLGCYIHTQTDTNRKKQHEVQRDTDRLTWPALPLFQQQHSSSVFTLPPSIATVTDTVPADPLMHPFSLSLTHSHTHALKFKLPLCPVHRQPSVLPSSVCHSVCLHLLTGQASESVGRSVCVCLCVEEWEP